jgi:hypothetical protein
LKTIELALLWMSYDELSCSNTHGIAKKPPGILVGDMLSGSHLDQRETQTQCPQHIPARLEQQVVQQRSVDWLAQSIRISLEKFLG